MSDPRARKFTESEAAKDNNHVKGLMARARLSVGQMCTYGITPIRTAEGWLFLCVVIDLYGKLVIGWSMGATQQRRLVLDAITAALGRREDPNQPAILHSDRGTQFTNHKVQGFLKDQNLVSSMSSVGHCGDNAACEGFFGVFKRERVRRRKYLTRAQARSDVFDYIERFHNPRMQL